MTISGLNRGAPKDIMNGLLAVRWLPPPAAGCNACKGRRKRSSTHPLCCLGPVAPHLATQLLPFFTGNSSPLRACPRSAARCAAGHAAKSRPPNPTDIMDSLPHTTGKCAAAAFNGLMGGGRHCEKRRKAKKLPERKERAQRVRAPFRPSAATQPTSSQQHNTPPPPHYTPE